MSLYQYFIYFGTTCEYPSGPWKECVHCGVCLPLNLCAKCMHFHHTGKREAEQHDAWDMGLFNILEFTSVQCELVIAEERDNIESDWYGISNDSKVVRFLYEDPDIHTPKEIFRPYQSHLITTHTYMHSYQAKVEHFNAALLKLKRTTQERLKNSCCTLGARPEHFLWVDKKCTLCLNTFDWQCEVWTCTQAYNFHLFHAKCVENMVSTLFSEDEDATTKCPNCRDEWQQ